MRASLLPQSIEDNTSLSLYRYFQPQSIYPDTKAAEAFEIKRYLYYIYAQKFKLYSGSMMK